jgi:hypothetical protein
MIERAVMKSVGLLATEGDAVLHVALYIYEIYEHDA